MTAEKPTVLRSEKAGWIHFAVVAGFLLIVAVGWNLAMERLGYWLRKEPVPWPAGVKVNEKTFQNQSFPKYIGPYRLAEGGDLKHADDMLSTLKIGSTLDDQRYPERKSNWYINRIYEDTREPENSPFRFWILDVVFYTGGEVTVPHVPDICVQAGGATPTGRNTLNVEVPSAKDPWRKTPFVALSYERMYQGNLQELVQYYLFSVNGLPETDRDWVRVRLADPTWRYVYYSKIQFFPRGNVSSVKIADEKAAEFLQQVLPAIFTQLPSAEDIQRLYK
ncbi:MAG: hypothetical protein JW849_08485 [Phycisphaerae bacterium]|nr:hypothetical protein [Phycisphaerae bacterium]